MDMRNYGNVSEVANWLCVKEKNKNGMVKLHSDTKMEIAY
jgi:hypothetical protein